ncbi:MAG TPA: hypothetical protein VHC71_03280 [Hyphomicrobium sp.]|nr:hypothetical protein [Hyphomicrobium sp.]
MSDRKNERLKALDRFRSLGAMTVENGCTESEAARAREAAQRVRVRYGIRDEELDATADEDDDDFVFVQPRSYPSPDNSRYLHPVICIAGDRVAEHFRCRSFFSGIDLVLIGEDVDTAAAHAFLADVIQASSFHLEGLKRYLQAHDDVDLHPRTIASEFRKGLGTRLHARLAELISEEEHVAGQELAISSSDTLDEIMSEVLPHICRMKSPFRSEITWAFRCGWIAGAYLRLPGEEGNDEPIDWSELARAENQVYASEPQHFATWESRQPQRRTIRRILRILLADLRWSTGWALYRVGGITGLATIVVLAINPDAHALINKALGTDIMNIGVASLVMMFIGEALGGDGPRPSANERRL